MRALPFLLATLVGMAPGCATTAQILASSDHDRTGVAAFGGIRYLVVNGPWAFYDVIPHRPRPGGCFVGNAGVVALALVTTIIDLPLTLALDLLLLPVSIVSELRQDMIIQSHGGPRPCSLLQLFGPIDRATE